MSSEQKNTTAETVEKKESGIWSIKLTGVALPMYLIMLVVLIVAIALGKLPGGVLGPALVLILIGNGLHFLGSKIPIVRTYLGGGSVVAIFGSAFLATFGILPAHVVDVTKDFINNMGFLDFYIAALITGSILGMSRELLIKASVRFLPVALLSMVITFFAVGLVGMLIGNGFMHSVLYVSLPIMAGGIGAGAVPLSSIYSHTLGIPASSIISQLIPASAMGNLLAIILAALVARVGTNFPKANGNGMLMSTGNADDAKQPEVKPDVLQMGVGFLVATTFFTLGAIVNYFVPKVHAYAFMIIIVFICKVFDILPKYYSDAAIMFNQFIVKNLTAAVLAGIGIALLNLNALGAALTWQFVVLCITSAVVISISAGVLGKLFGLYPVESVITAGLINNSMGGTGNVAVLSASNRMNLMAFAQMGNRLGGAIVLIVAGILIQFL